MTTNKKSEYNIRQAAGYKTINPKSS